MAWLKEQNIQGREAYWANIFRFFCGEWAKRRRLFTLSWCSYFHRFVSERKLVNANLPVIDLWWQPWFMYWFYQLSLCALQQPTTAVANHVTRWFHHFTIVAHGEKDIWCMKYVLKSLLNFVFLIINISFGELLYKVNLKAFWTNIWVSLPSFCASSIRSVRLSKVARLYNWQEKCKWQM